jgi:hypothetical protein
LREFNSEPAYRFLTILDNNLIDVLFQRLNGFTERYGAACRDLESQRGTFDSMRQSHGSIFPFRRKQGDLRKQVLQPFKKLRETARERSGLVAENNGLYGRMPAPQVGTPQGTDA